MGWVVTANSRTTAWRAALLAGVSSVAIACTSDALAACSGVDTGNVLCDAANPSGGALDTTSSGDTTVNINAGAGITGSVVVNAGPANNVTLNHNDPAGIAGTFQGITASNGNGTGVFTYTGSADVKPGSGGIVANWGGRISITQTAGTIGNIQNTVQFNATQDRSINVNTVGSQIVGPPGESAIILRTGGSQTDITIATGAVSGDTTQTGGGLYIELGVFGGSPGGRNFSVTTNGAVVGNMYLKTAGTGTVDLTTNASVTGGIQLHASNSANTNAFTARLNQDVTGDVSVSNFGTGTTTVQTRNITGGIFSAFGSGANSTLIVDGNIARGVSTSAFGGNLAVVNFTGGGNNTATFNGAISGTFDASAAASLFDINATGLAAVLGSTSSDGSAVLNAHGPITVTGISRPGAFANVTGAQFNSTRVAPVDVNLHDAVSATSISDTASTVAGISAGQGGLSTLRLTADGAITATANAAGSTAFGIAVGAQASLASPNPNTFIVRANGDVTATSDGAATGIYVTRGNAFSATLLAGAGGADLISKGTVTANSASAAAIGVNGVFVNDATNAATLSLRTEGNVIANGSAAGSYGIFAQRGGLGDVRIDVLAGVQSTGVGIGASRITPGNIFITAGGNAAITGVTGITTSGGTTTLVNNGTITGTGGTAVQFGGTNDVLAMLPGGGTFNGNVVGNGTSILQLGGTGAASFDVSQIGAAAQYQGFASFSKTDSSIWTLTGTSTAVQPWTVHGGTLAVDGTIGGVTVNAGGTLGGSGTVGNTFVNGGTLAPGNSIGTLRISGSLTMTAAATYLVQVSGSTSDRTIVTGTANIAGAVVVDPLTRLTQKTTYTILFASGLNNAFSSANLLVANNFARNPILSYVGNDVLLTLDPGLLSPVLPGNASANQIKVAGAIDNALLAGNNLSNAFSPIFNYSGNNLLTGLTQLSGETATGSQQTTFNAMTQFMGMMIDPFTPGRADGANAPAFAEEQDSAANAYASSGKPRSKGEREAYAAIYRKAPLSRNYDPRWSVWGAGFGGAQTTDGNVAAGSNTSSSRLFGVAAGADYIFSPNTVAGFALAGGGTSFSVAGGGSGRSDLFQAGAFIRHTAGGAYVTAAAAYGWQDITTDRTVTVAGIDRLRAQFNANAFSGRAEAGYRFVSPSIGGVGITPYAAEQFTTFDLPAYAEQVVSGANTFALAYGSKSVTATRSELGLRADKSFAMQSAILTLRGRAAWAHDFNTDRAVGATFQTLPGASFVVNGARQAGDSALTMASAEIKWMNGWSVTGTFEGEFSEITRGYAGKGVVRYAW